MKTYLPQDSHCLNKPSVSAAAACSDIYSESVGTREVLADEHSKIYYLSFELLVLMVKCAQQRLSGSAVNYRSLGGQALRLIEAQQSARTVTAQRSH